MLDAGGVPIPSFRAVLIGAGFDGEIEPEDGRDGHIAFERRDGMRGASVWIVAEGHASAVSPVPDAIDPDGARRMSVRLGTGWGALAAAVSRAGGLGLIGGGYGDPEWLGAELACAGDARIGVGFITWRLDARVALLDMALEHGVAAVLLSFGEVAPYAERVHAAGALLIAQVQSLAQARAALGAGADVIVAQGGEAGGHAGTVKEINLFTTELATPDNVQIIVPNSAIWSSSIVNYSHHEDRRVDLVFGVGYGADLKTAEAAIRETIANDDRVRANPEPFVMVTTLNASSVDFTVRVWCDAADYWVLKFDLTRAAKEALDKAKIDIPFPTRTIIQS